MSSRSVHQVLLLVPGKQVPFLSLARQLTHLSLQKLRHVICIHKQVCLAARRARMTAQPDGVAPRRTISLKDQREIVARAKEVFDKGHIDEPFLTV